MPTFGIFTSGGDAPGMNAAIRAAVRTATKRDVTIAGFLDGYRGLIDGQWRTLDDRGVGNILHRGGTVLGTSRAPEFHRPEGRARAANVLRTLRIDGLIAIGGEGTFKGALALMQEHGVAVVGLPGTIDNDVFGTDYTIGFDTAVNTALESIDRLRDTAEATGMVFFVEVMGRKSGELALSVGVSAGAEAILVPEAKTDVDDLCRTLSRAREKAKKSHIVVIAEGDDAGTAMDIGRTVSERIAIDYRVCVLGHIQRGGNPTARDRILASRVGAAAVEYLLEGKAGVMLGERDGETIAVSLEEAANRIREPDHSLLQLAMSLT